MVLEPGVVVAVGEWCGRLMHRSRIPTPAQQVWLEVTQRMHLSQITVREVQITLPCRSPRQQSTPDMRNADLGILISFFCDDRRQCGLAPARHEVMPRSR